MVRRSSVGLVEIARLDNLAAAFRLAARGRRRSNEVREFEQDLELRLETLGRQVSDGTVPVGNYRTFRIRDPKPRLIHAPVFAERVLHHAVMRPAAPVIDRSLVDDTFACRPGRGLLAAVLRSQKHARRFPWFVKIDIRRYFASVDHELLLARLGRRFRCNDLMALFERIVKSHQAGVGCGLPIGSLTSQHFANFYLDCVDRFLLEELRVPAMVRYMDDTVWWCRDRDEARRTRDLAEKFIRTNLRLQVHENGPIQRSAMGLSFLGFRVFPNVLHLTRRRRRRYSRARRQWEAAYQAGIIDSSGLQRGYDAVLAITAHADASGFRRRDLERFPPVEA